MKKIPVTDIGGIKIGHAQDMEAATGCTVILCEKGAIAGVDVRGGSPATRETDALNPTSNRKETYAVLLSGGSAFGLNAAAGVMKYLEERRIGKDVGILRVPNVCAAILFDLKCGSPHIRPDEKMGYQACLHASALPPRDGSVGAGTGATVGKTLGAEYAMKGGIASVAFQFGALKAGAIVAVNCVGDVYDGESGGIVAGAFDREKRMFLDSEKLILAGYRTGADFFSENTVIGCVVTNARLAKAQAAKLASVSQNGIARAVRPAHTVFDGDTVFTMCTGEVPATPDAVGILAAHAVEQAVINAVKSADSLCGYLSYKDLRGNA